MRIPFYKEFNEIHTALGLPYTATFEEINLFDYANSMNCIDGIGPYRTAFYQVFFIHHSDLTGIYNDTPIHFSGTNEYLFFACPGKLISWEKTDRMKGYIFSFKPSYISRFVSLTSFLKKFRFLDPAFNKPILLHSGEQRQLTAEAFEKLGSEFSKGTPDSLEKMFYYLSCLLIDVNRILGAIQLSPLTQKSFLITQFETLIRKHLPDRKSINFYASQMHMTPKYLSEVLKKENGRSAREVIQDLLILEARTLLLQTNDPISAVSHQLGFADPSHFIKLFRNKTGETPAVYRKKR